MDVATGLILFFTLGTLMCIGVLCVAMHDVHQESQLTDISPPRVGRHAWSLVGGP